MATLENQMADIIVEYPNEDKPKKAQEELAMQFDDVDDPVLDLKEQETERAMQAYAGQDYQPDLQTRTSGVDVGNVTLPDLSSLQSVANAEKTIPGFKDTSQGDFLDVNDKSEENNRAFFMRYGAPQRRPEETDDEYQVRVKAAEDRIMSAYGFRNINFPQGLDDNGQQKNKEYGGFGGKRFDDNIATAGHRLRLMYKYGATDLVFADEVEKNVFTNFRFEPTRAREINRRLQREYETNAPLASFIFNLSDNAKQRVPDIVLGNSEGAGKLIKYLRNQGIKNDYILRDLAFMEASGHLDYLRKQDRSTATLKGLYNLTVGNIISALGWMENSDDVIRDADGKILVDPAKFTLGANDLAAKTGLTLEQAEAVFAFSPDLVAKTTDVAPELAVDFAVAGALRLVVAKIQHSGWMTYLAPKFEKAGVKTLDEYVEKVGVKPEKLLEEYIKNNVGKTRFNLVNNWLRGTVVESVAIATKMKGKTIANIVSPASSIKKGYYNERTKQATDELQEATEELAKIKTSGTERQIQLAQDRVTRAENSIRRLYADLRSTPFLQSLGKEYVPAVLGAAGFAQVAQDASGLKTGALSTTLIEVGGSVAGAVMPKTLMTVYTAPYLISAEGVKSLANIVASVTGRKVPFENKKLTADAQEWMSALRSLEPEQYDQVVDSISRIDEVRTTLLSAVGPDGEPLFEERDVNLTIAELLNLPLLRIHEQALSDSISVTQIASLDDKHVEISRRLTSEARSIDRMGQALQRMEEKAGQNAGGSVRQFMEDMNSIHSALKAEYELRLAKLSKQYQKAEDEAMLFLTGQKFNINSDGSYSVPDWETAFEVIDEANVSLMKAQGASPDQILDFLQAKAKTRLDLLIEAGDAMKSVTNLTEGANPSIVAYAKLHQIKKIKEYQIDRKYRNWEKLAGKDETFMDGRWLFDDLVRNGGKGLDDEALADIGYLPVTGQSGKGARFLYGDRLTPQQIKGLDDLFGDAAERAIARFPEQFGETTFNKLLDIAGSTKSDTPMQQWVKINDYLSQADADTLVELDMAGKIVDGIPVTPEIFTEFAKEMSLPIAPIEMRMVASAFGRAEYDAAGRRVTTGVLEPRRVRMNFFDMAESEQFGFKKNFFDDAAQPVGEELVAELRTINRDFVDDIADRYRTGSVIRGWTLKADGRRAKGDTAEYKFKGKQGPASLFVNLARSVKNATEAEGYSLVEEPLAMAFGGRKYINPSTGLETYLLDAGQGASVEALRSVLASAIRVHVANSTAARNLLNNIDADKITEAQKEFLSRLTLAEDPTKIVEELVEGNDKFLNALDNLSVYQFNEAGEIIGTEKLLDMDAILDIFSFKNLAKSNKQVANLADDAREAVQAKRAYLESQAKVRFSRENSIQESAIALSKRFGAGEEGRNELYNVVIRDDGIEILEEIRSAYISRVRTEAIADNKSGDELKEIIETAGEAFDSRVRSDISRHINTTISLAGEAGGERLLDVDSLKLERLIGDANGTTDMQQVATNLTKVLGEEHYKNVKAIADFMNRRNATFSKLRINGEARALSIESWISRVYSISRGVVSPRYVISEWAIQHTRLRGQRMFRQALSNPEVADEIARLIRTGELPDEFEGRRFNEAMFTAIARIAREDQEESVGVDTTRTSPPITGQ